MPLEIEVEKVTYRVGALDAMRQFHVARRLAPILVVVMGAAAKAIMAEGEQLSLKALTEVLSFQSIAEAAAIIAQMSDADTEYVIRTCLTVVHRRDGDKWYHITEPASGRLMYDSLTMPAMLRLTAAVVQDNMASFTNGLLPPSGTEAVPTQTSTSG